MSCEAPEGSEEPDGKFAARDDTRWIKHGFNGSGNFSGEYADAMLYQEDDDPVSPRLEIHPVLEQNEVTLSLSVSSHDSPPSDIRMGVRADFTADQIHALADALEEVAECAEQGVLAGEQ